MSDVSSVRLDTWLWAARFFKTRAVAAAAIDGGKVEVNGARAKRAKQLRVGDRLRVRKDPFQYEVTVRGLAEHRGPPGVAAGLYEEDPEAKRQRERLAEQGEQLGAIVEVARQLERRHGAPWGGAGRAAPGQELVRVLRELMHVHDVRDAAQLVERGVGPVSLDPRLRVRQEQHGNAQKHDVLERLGGLEKSGDIRASHRL